uniref:(northern house mosquito) hypothetical protein n=1 Tax=Culex pipiens TaxID=7175 RepID=A0A8D8BVR3_CULPI
MAAALLLPTQTSPVLLHVHLKFRLRKPTARSTSRAPSGSGWLLLMAETARSLLKQVLQFGFGRVGVHKREMHAVERVKVVSEIYVHKMNKFRTFSVVPL